jgi:hypothetical protein
MRFWHERTCGTKTNGVARAKRGGSGSNTLFQRTRHSATLSVKPPMKLWKLCASAHQRQRTTQTGKPGVCPRESRRGPRKILQSMWTMQMTSPNSKSKNQHNRINGCPQTYIGLGYTSDDGAKYLNEEIRVTNQADADALADHLSPSLLVCALKSNNRPISFIS